MKTITLLLASAGLLLTMAAPVNAHEVGYREHDSSARYRHYDEQRREMPRWLKRQKSFRAWYGQSRYKHRRAISWARLYEIYSWDRRQYRRRHRDW
jgi:hypothetical protein